MRVGYGEDVHHFWQPLRYPQETTFKAEKPQGSMTMETAPEIKDAAPAARHADKKGFISVLPAIAPIAVAAVAIAPIMAPILTDTDGNAGFASIDSDAASAADAITTPRVAMPTMARAVATMDHFHSAAGIL